MSPVSRRRLTRVARVARVALCLSTILFGAASSTALASVRRSRSGLRIVVGALPRGVSAKIVVSGPRRTRRIVTHTGVLRLAPGRYVVLAAPVPTAAGTYYAALAHSHQRVRAGRVTTVRVSYPTLIPPNTSVVPATATMTLQGDPSGPRVLTVTGPQAASASVGQFLASGPSGAAPDGYLVKVVGVEHSGAAAVLHVENASLIEAVPSGEIDVEQTLEPSAVAAALVAGRAPGARREAPRERALARTAAEFSRKGEFSLPAVHLKCETSAGVHLKPRLWFSPHIDVQAKWGFFKLDSASVSATVDEGISLDMGAEAGAHCHTDKPGIGLLRHPIQLPDIDFQVGPIPVVITPSIQVYLYGSAGITASISASVEQTSTITVGVSYDKGQFSPIDRFSPRFNESFTAQGNASGELALRPTLDTLVYGVAGPSFDIGAAMKFKADTTLNPWWTLQGCIQAGVGFVVEILKINWSKPDLISRCKTLLSAKGPFPQTVSGGGSGGSGGSGSGGGTGGGGLCKRYETKGFETKCVET